MKLVQLNKKRMFNTVVEFLGISSAVFAGYGRLITEVARLVALNDKLDGYMQNQARPIPGMTRDKNSLLKDVIALTVKCARKALVYAKDVGNGELTALLNVQEYMLTNIAQDKALAKIENIYKGLLGIVALLGDYRVSAEDVDAIETGIAGFKDEQGAPGVARAGKASSTKGIADTIKLMDESLAIIDDLIVHGIDDNDFVNKYRINRRIEMLGKRKTGMEVTFVDEESGKGIEVASVTNVEQKKVGAANILGVGVIGSMRPGVYHFVFEAPGYLSDTRILKIVRGVTMEMRVKMRRE